MENRKSMLQFIHDRSYIQQADENWMFSYIIFYLFVNIYGQNNQNVRLSSGNSSYFHFALKDSLSFWL